jgi:methyltransferase (TIGR00027 family)
MAAVNPGAGLSGVPLAVTAYWTAAVRAHESRRPDRLLDDPWAAGLAGAEGEAWLRARAGSPALTIMTIRARFFDDFLRRATRAEGIQQVVLVAAGLDARGYRLTWPPEVRVFELDRPEVLGLKQDVLDSAGARPCCTRLPIGVDLTGQWTPPLLEAGFDSRLPSCWLLEGFLFYLPRDGIARMVDKVTDLACAGSWLGFDIVNKATLYHPLTRPWIDMQAELGAPWLGTLDDPAGFLARRGWDATLTQPGEPAAEYGRWPFPVLPPGLPGMPRIWFVTGRRRGHGS